MARFSFLKRSTEEEGLLGEEADLMAEEGRTGGGMRRILIIFGIGVLLIGGWYLANQLFLTAPPPPPTPPLIARPVAPVPTPMPAPQAPVPAAPTPAAPAKPPAKEQAKPAPPAPPPSAKAAPPPPAPAKPEPAKAPAVPEKAPPAKAEAKAPTKAAPAGPTKYSLQIGAMVMQPNADALKQKLDASGFRASIRKGTAFVTRQIVTVGDPNSKREAEDLSRRLNVDGFPSELVALGGKYSPQVGAFFSLDEAIDLARELQKKNYPPKIISKPANTVVFQVRHGQFDSRAAAVKRGEELKSKGFNFMVVRD